MISWRRFFFLFLFLLGSAVYGDCILPFIFNPLMLHPWAMHMPLAIQHLFFLLRFAVVMLFLLLAFALFWCLLNFYHHFLSIRFFFFDVAAAHPLPPTTDLTRYAETPCLGFFAAFYTRSTQGIDSLLRACYIFIVVS